MATTSPIARRRRPPLHWKYAVSVRKRWHRLRRLWRPDRDLETCRYFGATFEISPKDVIGHEMLLGRFEWLQIPAMLKAARELKPAAFIDIGANFGLYTCIIGRQRLARRLIAFEPNRWVLERLRAHIALNQLPDVEIHETAAGAAPGTASLFPGAPGYSALSTMVSAHAGGQPESQPESYDIAVVPLDQALSLRGQALIIKIDVEGYELPVLQGASALLERNYGYAQIESFEPQRAAAVIDTMAKAGWRLADHIVDDFIFRRSADDLKAGDLKPDDTKRSPG